jgi:phosphotransferase system enzyme I (PtsI)
MKKTQTFKGIGVSPGIAIGPVVVLREENVIIAHCLIDKKGVENEIDRLSNTIKKTRTQLQNIREKIAKEINIDHSFIFDAQLLMLEDEAYIGMIRNMIEKEKINAEWAVEKVNRRYIRAFESIDIEHIKEKSYDIRDLSRRIIDNLAGEASRDVQKPQEPSIIVARNLPPSYLSSIERDTILAIATEVGGKTSHISLLAKSLELPAVVGLQGLVDEIDPDGIAIIDGEEETLIVNPTTEQINS